MTITNLKEYKETRKIKKIVSDLENIEKLLTVVLKGVIKYKKYVPMQDIMNNIMENKAIINLHYRKYKNMLDEKK